MFSRRRFAQISQDCTAICSCGLLWRHGGHLNAQVAARCWMGALRRRACWWPALHARAATGRARTALLRRTPRGVMCVARRVGWCASHAACLHDRVQAELAQLRDHPLRGTLLPPGGRDVRSQCSHHHAHQRPLQPAGRHRIKWDHGSPAGERKKEAPFSRVLTVQCRQILHSR